MIKYGKRPERGLEKKERKAAYQGQNTGAGTIAEKFAQGGAKFNKVDVPQPDPNQTKDVPESIIAKGQAIYKQETGKDAHREIARMMLEKQRMLQLQQMLNWKNQMAGLQQPGMDQQQMPMDPMMGGGGNPYGGGGNPFGGGGGGQYF